jgi:hypothetical protein
MIDCEQELTIWSLASSDTELPRRGGPSSSGAYQASGIAASSSSSASSASSVVALAQDQERTGCEVDLQDYIVRHFLRFREGVLERQWKRQYRPYLYFLADQYLLEFASEDSRQLSRAYVIKDASISRVRSLHVPRWICC